MKKLKRKKTFYLLIFCIVILGGSILYYDIDLLNLLKEENSDDGLDTVNYENLERVKVRDIEDIYDDIHKMANTLIVAADGQRWGLKTIKDKDVDELIVEVSTSNYSNKIRLLEILNRWKNKDFSKGVKDHNYVWSKLGGNIGKAIDLRKDYK